MGTALKLNYKKKNILNIRCVNAIILQDYSLLILYSIIYSIKLKILLLYKRK